MEKYTITVSEGEKWISHEVEGELIKLIGFEDFDFIIHEAYKSTATQGFAITELITGGSIACASSKQKCVRLAMKNLNSVGVEGFKKMVEMYKTYREPRKEIPN